MVATQVPGVVPATVGEGADRFVVARAWPTSRTDDAGRVALAAEGPDDHGRLRAARLWLRREENAGWVVDEVDVLPPGHDRKLPWLAGIAATGQLIAHRFGKRAVAASPTGYVKVVREPVVERMVRRAEMGFEIATSAGFDAPQVLARDRGSVVFSVLNGESLYDLGRSVDLATWDRAWTAWAERWVRLTSKEQTSLDPHTSADEQRNLRRWTDAVADLEMLPTHVAATFSERVDRVCAALGDGTDRTLVTAHRDLHDKQILFDATTGRPGLVDFDTVASAEPELDLANLAVHVELRRDQRWWSAEHTTVAATYIRDMSAELGTDTDRLATYAEATRCRLSCLMLFRPQHRDLALRWVSIVASR